MVYTLNELHKQYYGTQDKTFKDIPDMSPFKSKKVVETKSFIMDCEVNKRKLVKIEYSLENQGITNFKISPSSSLKYLEIEVGGQRFGKYSLFTKLHTDVTPYIISDTNVFPLLKHHDIFIIFETSETCTITVSYDIVELEPSYKKDIQYTVLIKQEQYTGDELFNDDVINSIPLNYNHPIICI